MLIQDVAYIDFKVSKVQIPFADRLVISYEHVPVQGLKDLDEIANWVRCNAFNPDLDKYIKEDNRASFTDLAVSEFDIAYEVYDS